MTTIRAAVRWFAGEMEKKLVENDHKGDWLGCHKKYLLERLDQEVTELRTTIAERRGSLAIRREAADVANFAMMLADIFQATPIGSGAVLCCSNECNRIATRVEPDGEGFHCDFHAHDGDAPIGVGV